MTHLVTFTTSQFDVAAETPNPINPIAGQGVLEWLREKLRDVGYEVTAPEPEDWGWYIHAKRPESSYLIGASADVDQPEPREWTLQIHRQRSLIDKLMGRNKLADIDPLTASIEGWLRENSRVQKIQVDRSA